MALGKSIDSSRGTTETVSKNDCVSSRGKDASVENVTKGIENIKLHHGTVWKESELPRLLPYTLALQEVNTATEDVSITTADHFGDDFIQADVVGARLLTSDDAAKKVWHVEMDTGLENFYFPGDAFGLVVYNKSEEVERVLSCLSPLPDDTLYSVCKSGQEGSLSQKKIYGTARRLLADRVDLRSPVSKAFLRAVSKHCLDKSERNYLLYLCCKSGRKEYTRRMRESSLGLLNILTEFPSCRPPLVLLINGLPALQPRCYSAASATDVDGSVLHFAFTVVPGGIATGILESACKKLCDRNEPSRLYLLSRKSPNAFSFRPPSLDTNQILIGPMTGVAPFRGFLRQRQRILSDKLIKAEAGKCILFFGCRDRSKDFLYRKELEGYTESGVLTDLSVACSREGVRKVYVQDKMLEASDVILRAIVEDKALIYLCGDGGDMAKGVDVVLEKILNHHFDDNTKAKDYLRRMIKEGRYRKDVWFWGDAVEA